jgi:hypothetical protein
MYNTIIENIINRNKANGGKKTRLGKVRHDNSFKRI